MSGRKPWPQKGTGRARHGTRRSPMFKGGAVIHGPRSHTTHFYMLPFYKRVFGLTSTLSVKLAQVCVIIYSCILSKLLFGTLNILLRTIYILLTTWTYLQTIQDIFKI